MSSVPRCDVDLEATSADRDLRADVTRRPRSSAQGRSRIIIAAVFAWGLAHANNATADVLTYHGSMQRSGHYVVPALTWERGRNLKLDGDFHASLSGHVYAQPLYWHGSDSGPRLLVVATEGRRAG